MKIYIAIFALVIGGAFLVGFLNRFNPETSSLDTFAQCLAEKGAVMYGAEWCPHCQNEKKAFGKAFQFVPYVECPEDPQKCILAGIQGYPTWVFPDGRKFEGEQGIEKLSQVSGCPTGQ